MTQMETWSIAFIGIADHFESGGQPFPVGPVDFFQLSQYKAHIFYPTSIQNNEWVFVISGDLLEAESLNRLKIHITDEEGNTLGDVNINLTKFEPEVDIRDIKEAIIPINKGISSMLLHFKIDTMVMHPGKYIIQAKWNDKYVQIGEVYFHYQPTPPLTGDQIKAIESDPNSAKSIRVDLGCKYCPTKLKVYTAMTRQPQLEEEGCIWQYDAPNEFKCECGKAYYPLKYLKESLHGMLLKRLSKNITTLSYVRSYAHTQIIDIVNEFDKLLETKKDEKTLQEYIEKHPVMLARFHAKRLFVKPTILGRFQTDFAILNTSNQLLMIELEKPTMRLFKRNGHPTADLMGAYGQVQDWLHEYAKYPTAVLEGLNLKPDQVVAVRGVVIGGRLSQNIFKALQRHLSNPPYSDTEFLTLDDLSKSLIEISRKLA